MPDFTTITFRRGDIEYGLSLGLEEEQLSEGIIDFKIRAFRRGREPGQEFVVVSHITIEEDEEKGALLKIAIGDEDVFTLPLAEVFDEESVIGRALESVHATVFGGDLLIGCLVRSGCSATIGEIISCKNDTAAIPWFRRRAVAMGKCLRQHIPEILMKTMFRATRCVLQAGF